MRSERWQDWDDFLIGLWVFLSPWVFDLAAVGGPAAWSSWVLGGAVALIALVTVSMPRNWEEPINALLGVCLFLSPWVLGFSNILTATASHMIAGMLVTALACWAMYEDGWVRQWWQARQARPR
jgi:hypothetical protein